MLVWKNNSALTPVNMVDGDAEYYYYYLQSSFIDPALIHYDWLKPGSGSYISHHPVGVSLLLLPFFILAFFAAHIFHYAVDGSSAPFQLAISAAAIFYGIIGLIYLKKLLRLNKISDRTTALITGLVFFGTTLLNYAVFEGAMSHVYSFCFITAFLYYSCNFVMHHKSSALLLAALTFGIVLLLRANNGLIILSLLFWFKDKEQSISFFKRLVKNQMFYYAILIVLACIAFQLLTWAVKENNLFTNRYAPYGFYWLHPQFFKMLFGFDNGFFIYTPICFLFLFGLISVYKENKFLFYTLSAFILGLFYFFSSYSAYTYFDGLSIRVLVDYYAVFALLGAKLFANLAAAKVAYNLILASALFFAALNIIYVYQSNRSILLRSGMTFEQWKYVFLKTSPVYRYALGGSHDLAPYSKNHPQAILASSIAFDEPFNFSQKEFGPTVLFHSIGFNSKRIQLRINCSRKELFANASKDAMVCMMLQDKAKQTKSYAQFRLNETPSLTCCDEKKYDYSFVMNADFNASDKLAVYVWNVNKQPFLINELAVKIYNYNYTIN